MLNKGVFEYLILKYELFAWKGAVFFKNKTLWTTFRVDTPYLLLVEWSVTSNCNSQLFFDCYAGSQK